MGNLGKKDYHLPVPYNHENKDKISVTLILYHKTEELGSEVCFVSSGVSIVVKFSAVFSHANLEFWDHSFVMASDELRLLETGFDRIHVRGL